MRTRHRRPLVAVAATLLLASIAVRAEAQAAAPPGAADAPAAEPGRAETPTSAAPVAEPGQAAAPSSAAPVTEPGQAAAPPPTASAAEPSQVTAPGDSATGDVAPNPQPSFTEADLAAAAAATAAAAVEAELAARELEAEAAPGTPELKAYGFADFTYARRFDNRNSNLVGQRLPSFYVGNINLYLDGDLGNHLRALTEVRFTYLPDGSRTTNTATGEPGRVSAAYTDYADYYRSRNVGGVIIERAWVEYAAHPLLTIRAGQWLTPYGIWNVDHVSPVVVGAMRPYIVGNEWLPEHQTGLQLYGTHGIDATSVGYHLTVSNGRGPTDTFEDLDRNKAVGWRLWVKHDSSVGAFVLGTSGYRGRYTDTAQEFNVADLEFNYPTVSRYEELGLAADFKWTWGGYLLQGEAIVHDVAYDDRVRPTAFTMGTSRSWQPDERAWGYYAITGYRLPWFGVMPFVGNQYLYVGKGNPMTCWELNGGFNVRPTNRIVLKAVDLWVWRPDPAILSKSEGQFLAQAAWSF